MERPLRSAGVGANLREAADLRRRTLAWFWACNLGESQWQPFELSCLTRSQSSSASCLTSNASVIAECLMPYRDMTSVKKICQHSSSVTDGVP